MAKDKERRVAHYKYVQEGMNAKQIAAELGVSPNTVGDWVKKGDWKKERTTRNAGPEKERSTINEILESLTEERLDLLKIPKEERTSENLKRVQAITQEVATLNKRLETIARQDGKISLEARIRCMDDLFERMKQCDPNLYLSTIDFQSDYLEEITQLFG